MKTSISYDKVEWGVGLRYCLHRLPDIMGRNSSRMPWRREAKGLKTVQPWPAPQI